MVTQLKPLPKTTAKSFGHNLESDLALEFLRVVENAAIASARTMGKGDRKLADAVWSYPHAEGDSAAVTGYQSFLHDALTIEVGAPAK